MTKRNTADVLRKARELVETARMGVADLVAKDPQREMAGLRNAVVFGRAVTNVLQNLRSVEPGFDEWYQPFVEEMSVDPLMRYFYALRSEILKEGGPETINEVYIQSFSTNDLASVTPPPGAGTFVIDGRGRPAFQVKMPDGSISLYFVTLPPTAQIEGWLSFTDPPYEHRGEVLTDTSVETLSHLYVEYLERMVESAEQAFSA